RIGVGRAGGQGAVDALEPPGDLHQALHQQAFDLVLRRDRGVEGRVAGAEGLGILAGQDRALGTEPVLPGIVAGLLGALRAGGALGTTWTRLGAARGRLGVAHGRRSPSRDGNRLSCAKEEKGWLRRRKVRLSEPVYFIL